MLPYLLTYLLPWRRTVDGLLVCRSSLDLRLLTLAAHPRGDCFKNSAISSRWFRKGVCMDRIVSLWLVSKRIPSLDVDILAWYDDDDRTMEGRRDPQIRRLHLSDGWMMDGWWMDDGWIDVLDLLQGTVRKVTARVSVEVGGIYPLINWADAMQHQISQYNMNTISILIYTQSLL